MGFKYVENAIEQEGRLVLTIEVSGHTWIYPTTLIGFYHPINCSLLGAMELGITN
jgi:hypothetical protein